MLRPCGIRSRHALCGAQPGLMVRGSPAGYWLSPNSANAWPLQGRIDIVAF
jgi:hypothetical protein